MALPSRTLPLTSSTSEEKAVPSPPLSHGRAAYYESYDIDDPPPHPGAGWTRFVCLSDTHSHTFAVPPGDVLLHAGDLSSKGTLKDLRVTLDWLKDLPHAAKFFMAGNHDICLDADYLEGGSMRPWLPSGIASKDILAARKLVRSKEMRKRGMHYLEYETATFVSNGGRRYTIYGSPAAAFYSLGAFQYTEEEAEAVCARIPSGIDILMTHSPPRGIGDTTRRGESVGCPTLLERVSQPDLAQCRLHVHGHIHEAHGVAVVGQTTDRPEGRISVNAAVAHKPHLPVIVDLRD